MSLFGASAPGKILLAGEYAVLEGAEALLFAVDRRALARDTGHEVERSPFLEAARAAVARELGAGSEAARAAARIEVDTTSLAARGGRKLGLGSSAAATVAAIGCALAAGGAGPLDAAARARIHELAHAAHGEAQAHLGARGSGADVAASVYGGVIAVKAPGPGALPVVRPLALPEQLHLVPVWTGLAAATAELVARVRDFAGRDPARYRLALREIADAASRLAGAFERDDAGAAVEAVAAGGRAIAALGEAAGLPLERPIHRDLATLAAGRGGSLKPTGAGAGDIALAAFAGAEGARGFRYDLAERGIEALDLDVDANGVGLG